MSDGRAAWFVDGSYLYKVWKNLNRGDRLDYVQLRRHLERKFEVEIADAYYFNAFPDPQTARTDPFHTILANPPPEGAGLCIKLYWLQERVLKWPPRLGGELVRHPDGELFKQTRQKGVDVGLAFHLMRSYGHRQWRTLLLATGDGDFHEVVQYLAEDLGVAVILVGTTNSISPKLLDCAQNVEYLETIADVVALSD